MPTKLGQNFLNDASIVTKIIQAANISSLDTVLEIGPGEGILTEQLANLSKKVLTIEIDDRLIPTLTEKLKNTPNITLLHADILDVNLPILLKEANISTYHVIANIPYYITSPIIRLLLETPQQPKQILLMVQKEVAERIIAKPGKMSILSNSVQYYADAEILFNVSRDKFTPTPKVDSAILKITPKTAYNSTNPEIKAFFRLIRAGFSAKRKTLLNNLSATLQIDKKILELAFNKLALKATVRAQELSTEDWKKLSTFL